MATGGNIIYTGNKEEELSRVEEWIHSFKSWPTMQKLVSPYSKKIIDNFYMGLYNEMQYLTCKTEVGIVNLFGSVNILDIAKKVLDFYIDLYQSDMDFVTASPSEKGNLYFIGDYKDIKEKHADGVCIKIPLVDKDHSYFRPMILNDLL